MKSPQWLRRAACAAGSALTAVALTATPVADAQSVLSEPDFSGMFAPGGNAQIVARDNLRGLNYVQSSADTADPVYFINGFAVKRLSRVSDSGYVDRGGADTRLRDDAERALGGAHVGALFPFRVGCGAVGGDDELIATA